MPNVADGNVTVAPVPSSANDVANGTTLANRQQFVQDLLPHQGTPASPLSPEDYEDTTAAVTACRHPNNGLCYYNARFGAKAKQCHRPCSLKVQGNATACAR